MLGLSPKNLEKNKVQLHDRYEAEGAEDGRINIAFRYRLCPVSKMESHVICVSQLSHFL